MAHCIVPDIITVLESDCDEPISSPLKSIALDDNKCEKNGYQKEQRTKTLDVIIKFICTCINTLFL